MLKTKTTKETMKKFIFTALCAAFAFTASAQAWEKPWIEAIKCCEAEDYGNAETHFNAAIDALGSEGDTQHANVYVDRARLYSMQGRHAECLQDLDVAMEQGSLEQSDLVRCVVTRILTNCNLGNNDDALEDMRMFKEVYPNAPILQVTNDQVIIRNVPECECYQAIAKKLFVSIGLCESENDIQMLKSGIMVGKRSTSKTDCGCGCGGLSLINKPVRKWQIIQSEQNCKNWCERCSVVAACWCGKTFKEWRCQAACVLATQLIKEGCNLCCDGGRFWQNCVKPFEDVAGKMGLIEPTIYCPWN